MVIARHHTLDTSQSEWNLHKDLFPTKKRTTACCLVRDAFDGSVAIFDTYMCRHSDVIIMRFPADTDS